MSRESDFISEARTHTKKLWESLHALKTLQAEWNAKDYGTALPDGVGANDGYTKTEVGAVVFETTDAMFAVLGQGHATNIAKLL